MPVYEFKWSRGNLSEGFSSVAKHLGLQPDEAVFMNSMVVNPEGKCWRITSVDDLEGVQTGSVTGMSGPGSTALVFPMSKSQREYCTKYLEEGGELRPVQPLGDSRYYPDASIVTALLDKANSASTKELLEGKVIANSYVTEEVEKLAEKVGGRTLMSCDKFLQFVGKDYLHKVAEEVGFEVPPGIVVDKPARASTIIDSFRRKMEQKGIDPDHTKVWIKPSSLCGGQGIVSSPSGEPENLRQGLLDLAKVFHHCGLYSKSVEVSDLSLDDPFKGISKFMPVVMEADVGQLPWSKKKLDDVAVNAILGPKGVVHIESTPFSVINGCNYTGSRLSTAEEEPLVYVAEVRADKLMGRMWKEGYRGYLGVDCMIVEQENGDLLGYLNDLNTRLCGASPLIGMAHKLEAKLGYRPLVFSTTHKIRAPENMTDPFDVIKANLGDHLYRGPETGYTGIAPTVVDVPPESGCISFRVIAIAKDEPDMKMLQNTLKSIDDKYEDMSGH